MVEQWAECGGFESFVVLSSDDKVWVHVLFEYLDGGELKALLSLARVQVKRPLVIKEGEPLLGDSGFITWEIVVL